MRVRVQPNEYNNGHMGHINNKGFSSDYATNYNTNLTTNQRPESRRISFYDYSKQRIKSKFDNFKKGQFLIILIICTSILIFQTVQVRKSTRKPEAPG